MFHEQIAKYTADHLRSHIEAYLAEVDAQFTGQDKVSLILPKQIEPASQVGGMIEEFGEILPQYGIDCLTKSPSQDDASLWSYEYAGQINGLVDAGSRQAVDKLLWRHSAAVESFIQDHRYLHQEDFTGLGFSIVEFIFIGTEWSGAEYMGEYDERAIWTAAFSSNVSWITSEEGPGQHG